MSKLSNVKVFREADFSEQLPWIRKLIQPLSSFFTDVTNLINGSLTAKDNLKWQDYEAVLNAGVSSFSFKWNKNEAPRGMQFLKVIEVGSDDSPAIGLRWDYDSEQKSVTITLKASDMNASKEYRITVQGVI